MVLCWHSTINFILTIVHKHGINLSKDPPDQYQCLKHRKKELPSMAVAGKGNNHISNRMRPLLAALCLSNFLGTGPTAIEGSSFFLCFKH